MVRGPEDLLQLRRIDGLDQVVAEARRARTFAVGLLAVTRDGDQDRRLLPDVERILRASS